MDADYSIELGPDDAVLDFPWQDPSGKLSYRDLKRHPELIAGIEEAKEFPELGEFLCRLNSARSSVETAKCDAWATTELTPEEDIYHASHKFVSYVDVIFSDTAARLSVEQISLRSLEPYEQFAKKLVELLQRAPEIPSAADICVRRCYFAKDAGIMEGLYFTVYVSGYGNEEKTARQNWSMGLKLVGNAMVQLSARGVTGGKLSC